MVRLSFSKREKKENMFLGVVWRVERKRKNIRGLLPIFT